MTNKVIATIAAILVICAGVWYFTSSSTPTLGASIDCGDTTCFTKLGALTSFQSDGASIFNGGLNSSSTLQVSGAFTAYSTSRLVGTTTLNQSLILAKVVAPSCIEFYATSTDTKVKLGFYATTTIGTSGVGLASYNYGTCN